MAMENKRIIQLSTERTTLGDDDYTIVDSDTNGTAKYRLSRLKETDTTLSVSGMAADAAATGQAISEETQARTQAVTAESQVRQAADTTLGNDVQDLKSALSNEARLRSSLADSVDSELATSINLLESASIVGKAFSSIAVDDPAGGWAWAIVLSDAIKKTITSGSTIQIKAFDNEGNLLDRNIFYYRFYDGEGNIALSLYNTDRVVLTNAINAGYEFRIYLSKNDSSYKNTVMGGVVIYTQTMNPNTGRYEPNITEYIPYEQYYINNSGLIEIGIGTEHLQITEGFTYAREHNCGVLIKPGIYNLNNEGLTINDLGPIAPKIVYGYGATLTLTFEDYATSDPNCSVINIDKIPSCEIYGLTIRCKNARYCIHDELYNYDANYYHHVFKDLTLIHTVDDPTLSHWVAPRCIGGGLGNGGFIEIVNCETHSWAYEDINYHSKAGGSAQTGEATIFIKDCAMRKNASVSNSGRSTAYMNKMLVSNCITGKNVPDSTVINIKKISWNMSVLPNGTSDFDSLFPIT